MIIKSAFGKTSEDCMATSPPTNSAISAACLPTSPRNIEH